MTDRERLYRDLCINNCKINDLLMKEKNSTLLINADCRLYYYPTSHKMKAQLQYNNIVMTFEINNHSNVMKEVLSYYDYMANMQHTLKFDESEGDKYVAS